MRNCNLFLNSLKILIVAVNKNALIRYKTIDKCLQNNYRRWTLEDLITACSDALYEYEGRDINVSKRTLQLDIQTMRSDKLGYNAPIEVYDRKYYRYADPDFSITKIPLNETDMNILTESVEMLRQFKDFSLFKELNGIIQRLEDKIYTEKKQQEPIIFFDKNEGLKGLEFLDILYQAILKKLVLKIEYKSFSARNVSVLTIHPQLLKEYNNRWFLICRKNEKNLLILALDRMISIDYDLKTQYIKDEINWNEYFQNTIGVSVFPEEFLEEVVLRVDNKNAPYVLTKPMHHSQELLEKFSDHSILIKIKVHLNFELERLILGFGESIEVIKPRVLRSRIKKKLRLASENYQRDKSADSGSQNLNK